MPSRWVFSRAADAGHNVPFYIGLERLIYHTCPRNLPRSCFGQFVIVSMSVLCYNIYNQNGGLYPYTVSCEAASTADFLIMRTALVIYAYQELCKQLENKV